MRPRKTRAASSSGDPGAASGLPPAPAIVAGGSRLRIGVRVSPSAPRTQVRGLYGDRLKVAVAAPPEDNRANQELIEALSCWLALPRDDVHIESGHTSRNKVVSFSGVHEEQLRGRLARLVADAGPGGA